MNKFMQFLLKVDKSIMKHLSPWWKEKGCHSNDNGNGATATFRFWYSIEIPIQRGSVRMRAKDGGALPDTGFPHVGGKAKEGQRAPDNSDTEQTRAFHTTYAFGPRVIVSAVIPSKRANGTALVRCKVEKVVVLVL